MSSPSLLEQYCGGVFNMSFEEWLEKNRDKMEAIDTENSTECDVCGHPCPDGELRCREDHDLQSYGPLDDEEKHVDGDLPMEAKRELNLEKER